MPQGRSCGGAVSDAPAAWAWASSASTAALSATAWPMLNSPLLAGPGWIVASFASSVRGHMARMRPPCNWNIATAPEGLVSSPTNSVPIELDRSIEVVDGEGDDLDPGLHAGCSLRT